LGAGTAAQRDSPSVQAAGRQPGGFCGINAPHAIKAAIAADEEEAHDSSEIVVERIRGIRHGGGARVVLAPVAGAQTDTPKSRKERAAEAAAAEAEAPKADYSKEFRKLAAPVQTAVNEKKVGRCTRGSAALEAIPAPTHDDLKAIATWRLQATQGVGDQDAFAAAIEKFLADGYAEPQNVGAMHRQLAAHYSAKKDTAKTLEHFQAFVDGPRTQGDELGDARSPAPAGRPQRGGLPVPRQGDRPGEGQEREAQGNVVPAARPVLPEAEGRRVPPRELEALVAEYPSKEYYSRIVALYQTQTKDDRTVMLNAYRRGCRSAGGLETSAPTSITPTPHSSRAAQARRHARSNAA
jgi:hypothetical protein